MALLLYSLPHSGSPQRCPALHYYYALVVYCIYFINILHYNYYYDYNIIIIVQLLDKKTLLIEQMLVINQSCTATKKVKISKESAHLALQNGIKNAISKICGVQLVYAYTVTSYITINCYLIIIIYSSETTLIHITINSLQPIVIHLSSRREDILQCLPVSSKAKLD